MVIKAITFDFWFTLYQSKPVKMDERLRFLKRSIEAGSDTHLEMAAMQEAFDVGREAWDRAWMDEYRTMGAREWVSIILNELRVSLRPAAQRELELALENTVLNDPPTLVAEARVVLPALADCYALAIISDTGLTPGHILHEVLKRDQVADHFAHMTFSDQLGSSKPHPDNFLHTLQALEVEPHEAVHIGDLLRTDIAGARQIGMRAVQYVGLYQDDAKLEVTPDAVIQNHQELGPLLRYW